MDAIITSPNDRAEMPVIAPRGELAARQLAMPAHSNPAGDIFGGWIMAEMDAAAGMTTTRLAEGRTVTVAVSNIVFMQPVKIGDTVCFYTYVKRIGRTSITLDVEVWVLRHGCGDRIKVTQAEFTFVAIGADGLPRPITLAGIAACRPLCFSGLDLRSHRLWTDAKAAGSVRQFLQVGAR